MQVAQLCTYSDSDDGTEDDEEDNTNSASGNNEDGDIRRADTPDHIESEHVAVCESETVHESGAEHESEAVHESEAEHESEGVHESEAVHEQGPGKDADVERSAVEEGTRHNQAAVDLTQSSPPSPRLEAQEGVLFPEAGGLLLCVRVYMCVLLAV